MRFKFNLPLNCELVNKKNSGVQSRLVLANIAGSETTSGENLASNAEMLIDTSAYGIHENINAAMSSITVRVTFLSLTKLLLTIYGTLTRFDLLFI
jgi:hypothetical protein